MISKTYAEATDEYGRRTAVFKPGGNQAWCPEHFPKVFQSQYSGFTDGNIISDCERGWHIRAYTETECNGRTWMPGHLRDFDLESVRDLPGYRVVRPTIVRETENEDVWVYIIQHFSRSEGKWKRIVHGWLIVRGYHGTARLLHAFARFRAISEEIVDYAIGHIVPPEGREGVRWHYMNQFT